jgi:predicted unusual protein kinase regulating ubiquinone biosynthesis (AarF/ABC1/UbiB family)
VAANLLIADAHEGNVIITEDSYVVPIDLNITEPSEEMKREILLLIQAG